ncbi:MAG: phosphate acetyltransferase [Bifidobacteriaceae bacterium]|nr:phosphate acetyltransferase [Bifidobacteriaceae bacterium]
MARSVFLASTDRDAVKSIVAVGLIEDLKRSYERVGVFRPVLRHSDGADHVLDLLKTRDTIEAPRDVRVGTTYQNFHQDPEAAMELVMSRYEAFKAICDFVVVVGSDHTDVPGGEELTLNAQIAANLRAPVLLVAPGADWSPKQIAASAELATATVEAAHARVIGLIATRVRADQLDSTKAALARLNLPTGAIPDPVAPATICAPDRDQLDPTRPDQVEAALTAFERNTNGRWFIEPAERFQPTAVTPLAFQQSLVGRARQDPKSIVLPEGDDDRVLRAAARVLELGAAGITILGRRQDIDARAQALGLDLRQAKVVDPADQELVERFAGIYAELRAHKGVTKEKALAVIAGSGTYFATMMVHTGLADGMVSGAKHTTADTIRPSFEIIKTKPGTEVVSSVFLMALADKVLVYGDCAVNPNPTPRQLAGIAVDSAATAAAFGVEPRVALISYSTGSSGAGPDVDAVREATALARAAAPDLALDGPIQYDAAVDPAVGASKMPGSPVAGRATVLVFPDLNTGNAVYKAVQRSAGAVAIGPVLQGLRKPVNDLSRGALVEDIVNTIIITACQAQ